MMSGRHDSLCPEPYACPNATCLPSLKCKILGYVFFFFVVAALIAVAQWDKRWPAVLAAASSSSA